MEVLFECHHPDAEALGDIAGRRTRFALRRLAWLVPSVRVRLSRVEFPGPGGDRRCRVELETLQYGTLAVSAHAKDFRVALDEALERAASALRRCWHRDLARRSGAAVAA